MSSAIMQLDLTDPHQCQELGHSCLLLKPATTDQYQLSRDLAALSRTLRGQPGIRDVVCGLQECAIYFAPQMHTMVSLQELVASLLAEHDGDQSRQQTTITIPVCYDGVDLADCARHADMRTEAFIHSHTQADYFLATIGFRPQFPYLLGLPQSLHRERRAQPRTMVPAGSVAIGAGFTGIYPDAGPGGWHLLGHTDPAWCLELEVGMQLRFVAVSDRAQTSCTKRSETQAHTVQLNCDMGERGLAHPDDLALLPLVDSINIACGGHAGNKHSAEDLAARAEAAGVTVCLHPSYPDTEGFGRRSLDLPWPELERSLDDQRACLPVCQQLKFHGALYNDACQDTALAERLADWCQGRGLTDIVTLQDGALASAALARGLRVQREGFADRAYHLENGQARLLPRSLAGAVLTDTRQVLAQVKQVQEQGMLSIGDHQHPYSCDTWCVHSDTASARQIVRALRAEWPRQGNPC